MRKSQKLTTPCTSATERFSAAATVSTSSRAMSELGHHVVEHREQRAALRGVRRGDRAHQRGPTVVDAVIRRLRSGVGHASVLRSGAPPRFGGLTGRDVITSGATVTTILMTSRVRRSARPGPTVTLPASAPLRSCSRCRTAVRCTVVSPVRPSFVRYVARTLDGRSAVVDHLRVEAQVEHQQAA